MENFVMKHQNKISEYFTRSIFVSIVTAVLFIGAVALATIRPDVAENKETWEILLNCAWLVPLVTFVMFIRTTEPHKINKIKSV